MNTNIGTRNLKQICRTEQQLGHCNKGKNLAFDIDLRFVYILCFLINSLVYSNILQPSRNLII